MVTKLDIMNSRKDEEWGIVGGKVQRINSKKIKGPIVENAIKEIVEVDKVDKVEESKKTKELKKTKKISKKSKF